MKLKSLKSYIDNLWADIEDQIGDRPRMLRHMVEKTAMDQRHLAQIDECLDKEPFTTLTTGSTGQQKTEINPLLAHRDKVSRTITDDLEALQLTSRSAYKKKEATADKGDVDPMLEYMNNVK